MTSETESGEKRKFISAHDAEAMIPRELRRELHDRIIAIANEIDPSGSACFDNFTFGYDGHSGAISIVGTREGDVQVSVTGGTLPIINSKGELLYKNVEANQELTGRRERVLGAIAGAGLALHRDELTKVPTVDEHAVTFGTLNDLILCVNALTPNEKDKIPVVEQNKRQPVEQEATFVDLVTGTGNGLRVR
ncbi:MAG: hypothetical protein ACKVOE_00485 [Rickettsiales bacterium]